MLVNDPSIRLLHLLLDYVDGAVNFVHDGVGTPRS